MKHFNLPNISANAALDLCLDGCEDFAWFFEINSHRNHILEVAKNYEHVVTEFPWDANAAETYSKVGVDRANLLRLYDATLDRDYGRALRDVLMITFHKPLCVYCSANKASELDHVLPKSGYPAWCYLPSNLVPSCGECNRNKGDKGPTSGHTFFHPYYDTPGDVEITASFNDVDRLPSFTFEVISTGSATGYKTKSSFDECLVGESWSARSGEYLEDLSDVIGGNISPLSDLEIREEITVRVTRDLNDSITASRLTWRTALFRLILENLEYFSNVVILLIELTRKNSHI